MLTILENIFFARENKSLNKYLVSTQQLNPEILGLVVGRRLIPKFRGLFSACLIKPFTAGLEIKNAK
jgi:hypothetical protein